MEQRVSLITLGVDDLGRARRFYETGLGWTPVQVPEGVVFYQLPGLVLALWGRQELAQDVRRPVDGRFSGMAIAINQRSPEEVDAVIAEAERAGATVLKRAENLSWGGYSGYFADLDGHVWEVAHNPGSTIHADGRTTFDA
jgi:uncharacterized protein